jgi:hypothetical protein
VSERVCKGCGVPLPPKTWQGLDRVWCSERCRREQYAGTCIDCGARTNGHDGPGKASTRCIPCANRHIRARGDRADMVRARAKRERIEAMWNQGMLLREIASEMGYSMGYLAAEMNTMRRAGYRVPHRYKRKAAA